MWIINFVLFNKLYKKGEVIIKKSTFKDINEVYNIVEIKDECIIVLENGNYVSKYIYEIKPIILLDLCDSQKENIIICYKEFLRQVNFRFQVLIINKEYNLKEYLDEIINNELKGLELYNNYILDMENKFKKESIFESFYYIIISSNKDNSFKVDNVENSLKILEKIGCKVEKVKNRNALINILNKSINKEW